MSLNSLIEEIENSAKKQEAELLAKARADAKAAEEEAEAKASELMQKAASEGKAAAQAQRAELLAGARLKGKKQIAASREALVQDAIAEMQTELKKYASPSNGEYKSLLLELVKSAAKEFGSNGNSRVLCRKEDQKAIEAAGFKVQGNISCIGGAIVQSQDGKVQVNNTFDFLIERHRDDLKHVAFSELFRGMDFEIEMPKPKQAQREQTAASAMSSGKKTSSAAASQQNQQKKSKPLVKSKPTGKAKQVQAKAKGKKNKR